MTTDHPAPGPVPSAMRGFGAAVLLAAAALMAAALSGPAAVPGGLLADPALRWFLSALAVAIGLLGVCLWRGAARFGLMAAVLLTGGAAQLYLTEPHWFPLPRVALGGTADLAMAALIAVEGLAAAAVLLSHGPVRLLAACRARFGLWPVALVALVTGCLGVSVLRYAGQQDWSGFALRLGVNGLLAGIHLAALIALAVLRAPFAGLSLPRWAAPALAVAASLVLGWTAFEHLPHVEDEFAYLFQARTFAGGTLSVPPPPAAALPGLEYYLFTVVERGWYAVTAPGWPAVLALGVAVGLPWLVNPLLFGAGVWFAQGIARARAGDRVATVTGLLMATSPWLVAAAASFMTHSLTITLILFAWWCLTGSEERRARAGRAALLAGLAMGWVFTTRPLDGLLIGVLTGAWVLFGPAGSARRAALYSLGAVLTGSLYLAYNRAMTGNPLHDPLGRYLTAEWNADANDFGFGPSIGPPGGWGALDLQPGHSVTEGILNTANNLSSLQFEMFGWAAGSLLLLIAALVWLRHSLFDRAMWAVAAGTVATLFFYWFAGSFYIGPRYWLIAAVPAIYLSARGFAAIEDRAGGGPGRLSAVLLVLCISSVLIFLPWRGITKYYQFGNFYSTIRTAAAGGAFGDAVVIVPKSGNPASALMLNDPWLRPGRPVFLIDWGALDQDAVAAAFPGRPLIRFTPAWKADPAPGPATP